MGWKLSRRTHQRFRHFRVWHEVDRSDESCNSEIPAMTSENRLIYTETSEPLFVIKPDKLAGQKLRIGV